MPTIAETYDDIMTRLSETDLKLSPAILDPAQTPTGKADGAYSITLTTVATEERWRAQGRVQHALEVIIATQVRPHHQHQSYRVALDREDKVLVKLMGRTGPWQKDFTLLFLGSDRPQAVSREWVFSRMRYTVEHYVTL